MHFFYILALSLATLAAALPSELLRAQALQPRARTITCKLTIHNNTPYPFHRMRLSEYDVKGLNTETVPDSIGPFTSRTIGYEITGGEDAAFDIAYLLEIDGRRTQKRFNIHLQARERLNGYTISAEVLGGLSTSGHGSDQGKFVFGDYRGDDGQSDAFTLAGDESFGYHTVEPPTQWMTAMGSKFRQLDFTQVVMPASHDASMYSLVEGAGGVPENTQTQDADIYEQCQRGARVFDVRPYIDKRVAKKTGSIRTGHFGPPLGAWGPSLDEVIDQMNRFVTEYPGELLVLDLSDNGGWKVFTGQTDATDFSEADYQAVLDAIKARVKGIDTVYNLKNYRKGARAAREPLQTFFDANKSPILVRLPTHFPKSLLRAIGSDDRTTGIFTAEDLPFSGEYSETADVHEMHESQLKKLQDRKDTSSFRSFYTLTFDGKQSASVAIFKLRKYSWFAKTVIYENIFNWSVDKHYANQIMTDYVVDKQVTAIAMSMNYRYGIRNLP